MFDEFSFKKSGLFLIILCFSYNLIDLINNIYFMFFCCIVGILAGAALIKELSLANGILFRYNRLKNTHRELKRYIFNNYIKSDEDIDHICNYEDYLDIYYDEV